MSFDFSSRIGNGSLRFDFAKDRVSAKISSSDSNFLTELSENECLKKASSGQWASMSSGSGSVVLEADYTYRGLLTSMVRDTLESIEAKRVNKIPVKFVLGSEVAEMKKRKKGMKTIPSRKVEKVDDDRNPSEFMRSLLAVLFTAAYMDRNRTKASEETKKLLGKWMEDSFSAINLDQLPIKFEDLEDLAQGIIDDSLEGNPYGKMVLIGKAILEIDKKARHNLKFSRRDMDLLSSIGGYFRNKSDSAWDRVFRSVDLLGVSEVSMMYVPNVIGIGRSDDLKRTLRGYVKKLLENPAKGQFILTFQQSAQFKKDHPKRDIYEKYMVTQRELRAIWNKGALSVLRKANSVIEVSEFRDRMKETGFDYDYTPKGFTAKIGLNGKKIELFTKDDKPIYGWPQQGRRIVMNNSFGTEGANQYVFKAVDDETGLESSYYTYDHHKNSRVEKFKMVETVMEDIEDYKNKWEAPLREWKPGSRINIKTIQSAQAYFMYDHQARIGGEKNMTAGKRTYGVTTWKVGHVRKATEQLILIKYSGKKGMPQTHRVKPVDQIDRKVIELILQLIEGKQAKDSLWDQSIFTLHKPNAAAFRKWLREMGFPSTPHKLRHTKGTKIAVELIARVKFVPDAKKSKDAQYKAATDFFKDKIATQVAKALGHKSASGEALYLTSVKSYIDPSVSRNWFTERGFRPPNWIPKNDE